MEYRQDGERLLCLCTCLLVTGMMGVFVSLDFFLFFIFWEVMLLPMYFLIGLWGGPRREYAAIKFFIYTFVGGILMLITMLALYFSVAYTDPATGQTVHTFNILHMMNPDNFVEGSLLAGSRYHLALRGMDGAIH
ncbi:MAG: proton-conducting transporter membrane subunit [Gracilimonas sp.]|nr:proton-conducting transporter membrane subunit [Gracilimonas sp.]